MSRITILTLPVVTLSGAVTLAILLEQAAAAETKLPATVKDALGDVVAARTAVQEALAGEPPVDDASVRPSELTLDHHWKLVRDLLAIWVELGVDESEQAQQALDVVFGSEGLAFTHLRAEEQLTESASRLQRPELQATLSALGSEPFWTELQAAHNAFQDAVLTAPKTKLDKTPLATDLKDAMQTYITRVQASVDRKDPATSERATRMLQAIGDWKAKTAREKSSRGKGKAPVQGAPTQLPVTGVAGDKDKK